MAVPSYGSDLVVDLLQALGIEYVSFNPGASFRGLHDSIVNYGWAARLKPQDLLDGSLVERLEREGALENLKRR